MTTFEGKAVKNGRNRVHVTVWRNEGRTRCGLDVASNMDVRDGFYVVDRLLLCDGCRSDA